jgi:NCS2 family nucleobase:cation symporter-2
VLIAPLIGRILALFPAVVTGSLITLLGISLLSVAMNWAGGGSGPAANAAYGQTSVTPFRCGLPTFHPGTIVTMSVVMLITLIESTGVFLAFPYTSFSQNVGLVSITTVRSRFVCAMGGFILIVLGLLPKLAHIVSPQFRSQSWAEPEL